MNSRERLQAALNHRQPDRVPVDFGATFVTGIHVSVVHQLRRRLLDEPDFRVKVIEPYQMLGEIDDRLREALGIDVIGSLARRSIFGTEAKDWKPFTTFDGTPCLLPGQMNLTQAPDGGWYMHPEGDTEVGPSGHMPEGAYFSRLTKAAWTPLTTPRNSASSAPRTWPTTASRRCGLRRAASTARSS